MTDEEVERLSSQTVLRVAGIENCARCGKDHEQLDFVRFRQPILEQYTHWSMCPITGEPIILAVDEVKADA